MTNGGVCLHIVDAVQLATGREHASGHARVAVEVELVADGNERLSRLQVRRRGEIGGGRVAQCRARARSGLSFDLITLALFDAIFVTAHDGVRQHTQRRRRPRRSPRYR